MPEYSDGLTIAGKQNPRLGEIRSKRIMDKRTFYLTERALYILAGFLAAVLILS